MRLSCEENRLQYEPMILYSSTYHRYFNKIINTLSWLIQQYFLTRYILPYKPTNKNKPNRLLLVNIFMAIKKLEEDNNKIIHILMIFCILHQLELENRFQIPSISSIVARWWLLLRIALSGHQSTPFLDSIHPVLWSRIARRPTEGRFKSFHLFIRVLVLHNGLHWRLKHIYSIFMAVELQFTGTCGYSSLNYQTTLFFRI